MPKPSDSSATTVNAGDRRSDDICSSLRSERPTRNQSYSLSVSGYRGRADNRAPTLRNCKRDGRSALSIVECVGYARGYRLRRSSSGATAWMDHIMIMP